MKTIAPLMLLVGCAAVAVACVSPETKRTRGGGPGADVGNRRQTVKLHEGSDPFWKTPSRIPGDQRPPLTAARQAQQRSRQ
jgi:hypothetical protein